MKILGRGIVHQPADERYNSKTFGCLIYLPSGRWLCGYKAGPTKADEMGQVALSTYSDDEGKTWSVPFEPFTFRSVDGNQVVIRTVYFCSLGDKNVLAVCNTVDATEPEKPFYNPETEGLKKTRIFAAISRDDGETYGDPFPVPTRGINSPTPLTGAPLSFSGEILIPFEVNKDYDANQEWIHNSCYVRFTPATGEISDPVVLTGVSGTYYWDQRLTVVQDRLLDYFWTFDAHSQTYQNIHMLEVKNNQPGELYDTGIPGQPGYGCYAKGRIYLPVVDRTASPQVLLYQSTDGRSFSLASVIYESKLKSQAAASVNMAEAWSEMALFSVGHPQAMLLPNSDLLIYYYAGLDTDHTDICFVRCRT